LDEETPGRPRRRTRRRKEEAPTPEAPEASNGADVELAADELPEGALSGGEATPIDEETLEAIRREVAADRTSEDELFELAASLPQEEDEAVEDEGWLAAGPVFEGVVPLDTPEQRLDAIEHKEEGLMPKLLKRASITRPFAVIVCFIRLRAPRPNLSIPARTQAVPAPLRFPAGFAHPRSRTVPSRLSALFRECSIRSLPQ
jgi:hypothetical protein